MIPGVARWSGTRDQSSDELPVLYDSGMSELPISEARDRLGEVVSRAEHAHERTVLTRRGKPVAVVISLDDLRELEAAEDETDLAAAREALADPDRVPHREVLAEYGIEID